MSEKNNQQEPVSGEIIFYEDAVGKTRAEVVYRHESFWLSLNQIALLFGIDKSGISRHLKDIYATAELDETATVAKIATVRTEGNREVTREITYYNLDAVISVGYRVNSTEATRFRIWATQTLRHYIQKGYVLDHERLKLNTRFGPDYFEQLLEEIREIRASERRFYQKITDLFKVASIDYDKDADITRSFYQTVQNKLHWAITGMTAAEIIADRADANTPHMGLTTWKNAPDGKILKSDTKIAKNYLVQEEIEELNRVVSMYLDFAENQARRHIAMKMKDWTGRLDAFLAFNGYEVLQHKGNIEAKVAQKLAEKQYSTFRVEQDRHFTSDFDKAVADTLQKGGKI